jgi:2-polyprenyl-6-methoxyphenol hydroxylase-like FAD-dependent oxidoreductase
MGNRRFRLMASNPLSRPSKDTAPALGELQAIYDQRSPIPARFRDMSWSSWFRINSRMVARLKVGRLLLDGDAAHIHSPAGAQGMNTGIQDMVNLAWKLALVLKGQAPSALLDTYEQERLPVIRDVLANTACKRCRFMISEVAFRSPGEPKAGPRREIRRSLPAPRARGGKMAG